MIIILLPDVARLNASWINKANWINSMAALMMAIIGKNVLAKILKIQWNVSDTQR